MVVVIKKTISSRSKKYVAVLIFVSIVSLVFISDLEVFLFQNSARNKMDSEVLIKITKNSSIAEIQLFMEQHNRIEPILNLDLFGPLKNNDTVIVVQVHDRIMYLKHVIESFSKAKGIEEALLIFTHDIYVEEVNQMVQNITFCKVLQMFYPFSVQTHPNEFPGLDPNDCTGNVREARLRNASCPNINHHDHNGEFRNGNLVQMKHHWFWRVNLVFDHLRATKNHTGLVLFTESDHYLVEDFLHVLKFMEHKTLEHPSYHFMTLGTYTTEFNGYTIENKIEISPWMNNLGLAFKRKTWNILKVFKDDFCHYDEYNWDYNLQHVLQQRLNSELLSMIIVHGPRAIHIGKCGQHIHESSCDPTDLIKDINNMLDINRANGKLFPIDFSIEKEPTQFRPWLIQGFGGWGDPRDQNLCMSMVKDNK